MYLQCAAHFVVAEYIRQLVEGNRVAQNVKMRMCLVGHPTGQTGSLMGHILASVLQLNPELRHRELKLPVTHNFSF